MWLIEVYFLRKSSYGKFHYLRESGYVGLRGDPSVVNSSASAIDSPLYALCSLPV